MVQANYPSDFSSSPYELYQNMDKEFEGCIKNYNIGADALNSGFDNIPSVRIIAGCPTWTMAFAYGCEMVVNDGRIGAKYLINNIEEICGVKKPANISEAGVYPELGKRIVEFQKRYGNVMISASDFQSANDVLTEIVCSEEVMIAMFDDKEPLKYLLDLITQSTIDLAKWQKSIIKNYGGHKVGSYFPKGIYLADDNAAFLSPSTYEEFDVPYNTILSEEFGGVGLHCCMKYEQNLALMGKTEGFMEFDPQTDFNNIDIIEKSLCSTNAIWQLNNAPWQKNLNREYSDEVMLKNAIDRIGPKNSIICSVFGNTRDEAFKLAHEIKNYAIKSGFTD